MARLHTSGLETGNFNSENYGNPQAAASVVAGAARTGGFGYRPTASNDFLQWVFTGATNRDYYLRAYFRKSANPSTRTTTLYIQNAAGGDTAYIYLETNGTLTLREGTTGTQIGSASAALADNTWYRIELHVNVSSLGDTHSTVEARLDGTQFANSTTANAGGTNAPHIYTIGPFAAAGITIGNQDFDDVAFNDGTGSFQTGFPGVGRVWISKPVADSAVGTGWEAPQTTGSDVTNIFDAVDNIPPVGVAHSDVDTNNLKYIFNATSTTTGNYDATCQSYAAVAGNSEIVQLCQSIFNTGSSSTTDTAGAIQIMSNPIENTETSFANFDANNVIAGTFPTGWGTGYGQVIYVPSITRTTQPVLRIGKRTNTTRVAMVDFMGIMFETTPAGGLVVPARAARNSLLRR